MSNYKVDAGNVNQEPYQHTWAPPEILGTDHTGIPHYRPYRSCTLSFDVMLDADFAQWAAFEDGAVHTATIPHPDSGTFTQYSDIIIKIMRHRRRDINVYDVEVKIERVAGLVP